MRMYETDQMGRDEGVRVPEERQEGRRFRLSTPPPSLDFTHLRQFYTTTTNEGTCCAIIPNR